jgi:hypothetical protein
LRAYGLYPLVQDYVGYLGYGHGLRESSGDPLQPDRLPGRSLIGWPGLLVGQEFLQQGPVGGLQLGRPLLDPPLQFNIPLVQVLFG